MLVEAVEVKEEKKWEKEKDFVVFVEGQSKHENACFVCGYALKWKA
uniref:Uncharacterized protein n=1 Tax=Meloidogyne enterolobii TaxID=390850 RepID=A0A6V7TJI1_MELEN|nr:unnamed protein product [Meloidogyne enterolobii]